MSEQRSWSVALMSVAALVTVSMASLPTTPSWADAAVSASPPHQFRTWTDSEAVQASPNLGTDGAKSPQSSDYSAARRYADRVSGSLPAVVSELGSAFISAAIDARVGNRLVVHVTDTSRLSSPTLEALDSAGGEVRLVVQASSQADLQLETDEAKSLVGSVVGQSKVLSVARDDMAGRVVVGVDQDAAGATSWLQKQHPLATAYLTVQAVPLDSGTWGNNPARAAGPVAGGDSIAFPVPGGVGWCTTALTGARHGVPVVVTAGHCTYNATGPVSLAYSTGCSNTCFVSPEIGDVLVQRSVGDVIDESAVQVTNQGPPQNYIVTATSGYRTIAFSITTPVQGEPVAKTGATSGETTGNITSVDVQNHLCVGVGACWDDPHMIAADVSSFPGDSGGVLYRDNGSSVEPLGILSGGANGSTQFTNWRRACPDLQMDVCPPSPPPIPGWYGASHTLPAVWRPVTNGNPQIGTWYTTVSSYAFGQQNDTPVPGDYDGDGKLDYAVFRPGYPATWYIKLSASGVVYTTTFGQTGDIPVQGDYTGDGRSEIAVARSQSGTLRWYSMDIWHNTFPFSNLLFGNATDTPVPGDWYDVGHSQIAVWRPSGSGPGWYVQGYPGHYALGQSGDKPVAADYDRDGRLDQAVFRPGGLPSSPATWIIHRSSDGVTQQFQWGITSDIPTPGDYKGDRTADPAVWRSGSPGTWYVYDLETGVTSYSFGQPGDVPVAPIPPRR